MIIGAENIVDLAAEVTVVFHWMVHNFKINLVTKTIMKNNVFKIKMYKRICLMLWRMTLTFQYQGHCSTT